MSHNFDLGPCSFVLLCRKNCKYIFVLYFTCYAIKMQLGPRPNL